MKTKNREQMSDKEHLAVWRVQDILGLCEQVARQGQRLIKGDARSKINATFGDLSSFGELLTDAARQVLDCPPEDFRLASKLLMRACGVSERSFYDLLLTKVELPPERKTRKKSKRLKPRSMTDKVYRSPKRKTRKIRRDVREVLNEELKKRAPTARPKSAAPSGPKCRDKKSRHSGGYKIKRSK